LTILIGDIEIPARVDGVVATTVATLLTGCIYDALGQTDAVSIISEQTCALYTMAFGLMWSRTELFAGVIIQRWKRAQKYVF